MARAIVERHVVGEGAGEVDEFDADYYAEDAVMFDGPDLEAERPRFLKLVAADVRGDTSKAVSDWLRSDDVIRGFQAELKAMAAALQQRIAAGERRSVPFFHLTTARLAEINATVKRRYAEHRWGAPPKDREAGSFRPLVRAHRAACRACGDEPRPYDLILWQALEIRSAE